MADERAAPMMPTVSLGELLTATRAGHGLSRAAVGRAAGIGGRRVAEVERGRHDLSETELGRLLDAYPQALSSRRLARMVVEIDLDDGLLRLHQTRRRRSAPVADRNLLRYLALLHQHLDLDLGRDIPLKAADLGLLRASLALRRDEVTSRLDHMGGADAPGPSRNRSLLAVALASGLAVVAGAVILVPSSRPSNGTPPPASIDPRIDIGTPMVVERDPADIPTATTADPTGRTDETGRTAEPTGAVSATDPSSGPQIGLPMVVERPGAAVPPTPPDSSDNRPRGPPRNRLHSHAERKVDA